MVFVFSPTPPLFGTGSIGEQKEDGNGFERETKTGFVPLERDVSDRKGSGVGFRKGISKRECFGSARTVFFFWVHVVHHSIVRFIIISFFCFASRDETNKESSSFVTSRVPFFEGKRERER